MFFGRFGVSQTGANNGSLSNLLLRGIWLFLNVHFWSYVLHGFLNGLLKFRLFFVENCFLIRLFKYFIKNMACAIGENTWKRFHRLLIIRGNDFIAHWVYAELIFLICFACAQILTVCRWTYKRMLRQHRNDFTANWVYSETIYRWFRQWRNFPETNFTGTVQSSDCIQSELRVRHLWVPYCIHPFFRRS